MEAAAPQKVVRSYRLVFRRRWRIYRVQNWRIPLPGGIELRAIGYWLASLIALALLGRVPLIGAAVGALAPPLRIIVVPLLAAWLLCRWEVDGRGPHQALVGIARWVLRPRWVSSLRRCPAEGAPVAPPPPVAVAPDTRGSRYPRGCLVGPVRVLLRYPVAVEPQGGGRGSARERAARAKRLRLHPAGRDPLQLGHTLAVPAGRKVSVG